MRKLLLLIIFNDYYCNTFVNRRTNNIPVIISYNAFCRYKRYVRIVKGLFEEEFESSLVNRAKLAIMQGKSYGSESINKSILNM